MSNWRAKKSSTERSSKSNEILSDDRREKWFRWKNRKRSNSKCVSSKSNWEEIIEAEFQSLDIDADGFVSRADLQSVLKNFSHLCNSNEILRKVFDQLDVNHDERISKEEFKLCKTALINAEKHFLHSSFEEKLASIFSLFDRNGDNYISSQEIRETMTNLGEEINDHRLNEMMKTADINHDGRISREEFKKLLLNLYSIS